MGPLTTTSMVPEASSDEPRGGEGAGGQGSTLPFTWSSSSSPSEWIPTPPTSRPLGAKNLVNCGREFPTVLLPDDDPPDRPDNRDDSGEHVAS